MCIQHKLEPLLLTQLNRSLSTNYRKVAKIFLSLQMNMWEISDLT